MELVPRFELGTSSLPIKGEAVLACYRLLSLVIPCGVYRHVHGRTDPRACPFLPLFVSL